MSRKEIREIKALVKDVDPDVGVLDFEGVYLYKLARKAKADIIEIGSWKGRSTLWLSRGAKSYRIWAVDPHSGTSTHKDFQVESTYGAFLENIRRTKMDNVVPVLMTSEQFFQTIFGTSLFFDLVFIDADHTYQAVRFDFTEGEKFLRKGGVVVFHDTIAWEGPRTLVKEIFRTSKTWQFVGMVGQLVAFKKVSPNPFYKVWNLLSYVYFQMYSWVFRGLEKLPTKLKEVLKTCY